jgi:dTDP-4-dehydrorhamnose reductase
MRVLILGGSGMLGHKLYQVLNQRFDTWATLRSSADSYDDYGLFVADHTIGGVDVFTPDKVAAAIDRVHPDAVVNCIGIIKQRPEAENPVASITVNSLFPHQLARMCASIGVRLVHISTDCVFSGSKGMYIEDDYSDAEDLYGRTKYMGEVSGPACLTLRTSIIGRELHNESGLVEWFLSNEGSKIRGYTHSVFSGLTTLELAAIVEDVLDRHPNLSGLFHVSSDPINKHDLLVMIRNAFGARIEIEPDGEIRNDRSLDSNRFRLTTSFKPRPWVDMIADMANDTTPYVEWRRKRVT